MARTSPVAGTPATSPHPDGSNDGTTPAPPLAKDPPAWQRVRHWFLDRRESFASPDWAGGLGQYITLATLAGGAAIALTPTLNTLLDRALTSAGN